jgi:hypothetical protein
MGIDDLPGMDAPLAKGGRPSKEEVGDTRRDVEGDPITSEKDSEEYWQNVYDEYVDGKIGYEELQEICEHCYCLPWTVVRKLSEYEIADASHLIKEEYPTHESKVTKKSETTNENDDQNKNSGLSALIDKT